MTHDEFESLVARLEPMAKSNPSGYELRVMLLAMAGYAYLAGVVILLILLIGGALAAIVSLKFIAIKVLLVLVPIIWLVAKAMWIKFPPPEGVEVTQAFAPALFAIIEKLRKELRCARFHHVLITNDFNAAVYQNPRLGPFGWHRNYLLIGLPLMKALSPAQLEAVLAHEFGHLAGGHGALGNRLYRLRLSWARLLGMLEHEQSVGRFLFQPFFNWYSPYFSAYSFPLARANEYQADAVAGRLCGNKVMAEALTGVAVVADYLDTKFWPGVHKQAEREPAPGFAPFHAMSTQFSQADLAEGVQTSIELAFKRVANVDDTHPAFGDRLKALGESPTFIAPGTGSAADTLLGQSLGRITDLYDEEWKRAVTPSWQARYESVQAGREKMAAFAERERNGETLPVEEAFEHAMLIDDIGAGKEECLAHLRVLHARSPEHAPTSYHLGARLLALDDNAGIALVEKCMALDEESILPGCALLFDYCKRHQLNAEADRFQSMYEQKSGHARAVYEEENTVRVFESFEPHGLSPEKMAAFCEQLKAIKELRKVYFVRRRLKHQPDRECFSLGFEVTPWWSWQRKSTIDEAQRKILADVNMMGSTTVFCVEGENVTFARKFRKVRGSRII